MNTIKQHHGLAQFQPFGGMLDHFFNNIDQQQGRDDAPKGFCKVNITEGKSGFKLELYAPGLAKENLKLNVEKDTLTINGEHEPTELQDGERFTRREFAVGPFKRSFRLPEDADVEGIKAEHLNGVLTVDIPTVVEVEPMPKEISIA